MSIGEEPTQRGGRLLRALACTLVALGVALPALAQLAETVPAPTPRPDAEAPPEPAPEPGAVPTPSSRPDPSAVEAKDPPGKDARSPGGTVAMPAAERACRARLREMGVRFEERERLAEENGCLVPYPVAITAFGPSVSLEPEAVLNCATAMAAAEFVADTVSLSAEAAFGSPVTTIRHASAYVCRSRHNGSKMSEHAFGNAIDFSAFELADGRVIEVKAHGPGDLDRRDFLRKLRGEACGSFKTVLGPGSDGDHADHLHFDLAQRRAGGTYCK